MLLPVIAERNAVALLYGDWALGQPARKITPQEMGVLNELAAELGRFFAARRATIGSVRSRARRDGLAIWRHGRVARRRNGNAFRLSPFAFRHDTAYDATK